MHKYIDDEKSKRISKHGNLCTYPKKGLGIKDLNL
jgi:hypothetical protein